MRSARYIHISHPKVANNVTTTTGNGHSLQQEYTIIWLLGRGAKHNTSLTSTLQSPPHGFVFSQVHKYYRTRNSRASANPTHGSVINNMNACMPLPSELCLQLSNNFQITFFLPGIVEEDISYGFLDSILTDSKN